MKKIRTFRRRLMPALLVLVSLAWSAFAQPDTMTLNLQNATVLDAVRAINRQADNSVSFIREELERETKRVNLSASDITTAEALARTLAGTRLRAVEQGDSEKERGLIVNYM